MPLFCILFMGNIFFILMINCIITIANSFKTGFKIYGRSNNFHNMLLTHIKMSKGCNSHHMMFR